MSAKKGGLGKGLDAIFIENDTENKNSVMLKILEIEPNREQPRNDFDEKALKDCLDEFASRDRRFGGLTS